MAVVPSNVLLVLIGVIPLTKYDFGFGMEGNLDFDMQKEVNAERHIQDQMGALAYPTMNAVKNLDSITIFLLIYFSLLASLLALKVYMTKKQRFRRIEKMNGRKWISWERDWRRWDLLVKIRNKLFQTLILSMILSILIEAYLIFAIAGIMQIQLSEITTDGEFFGVIFGYFSILVVYSLPIVFVFFFLN